jgi:hypothetical protein
MLLVRIFACGAAEWSITPLPIFSVRALTMYHRSSSTLALQIIIEFARDYNHNLDYVDLYI